MKSRTFKSLLIPLLLVGSLSGFAKSHNSDASRDNSRTENRGSVFGTPSVFFVWYGDVSGSNPATPVIAEFVASLAGSSYLLLHRDWRNDRGGRCESSDPSGCAHS